MSTKTSVVGAVAGAGLMYVLDPAAGARRRAFARDRIGHVGRRMTDTARKIARDAQNRGRGLRSALGSAFGRVDVPDGIQEARIRAALGMLVRYPRLVEVRSELGTVHLRGVVAADEIGRLVRRIRGMPGVARLEHQLQVCRDPADLPGAPRPAPPRPRAPRLDVMRRRWSPSVRAGGTTVGSGLLVDGVRRGGLGGMVLGVAGILVLFRALTNKPLMGARSGESWTDLSR